MDKVLPMLAPAFDTYIGQVVKDIIGPDFIWTDVLHQLDTLKDKPLRTLNHLDPAWQFRMLTERLGEFGHPFAHNNRSRLCLSRNQLTHGDDTTQAVAESCDDTTTLRRHPEDYSLAVAATENLCEWSPRISSRILSTSASE